MTLVFREAVEARILPAKWFHLVEQGVQVRTIDLQRILERWGRLAAALD